MGLFMLLICLVQALTNSYGKRHFFYVLVTGIIGAVLILSNAVLAAVTVVVMTITNIYLGADRALIKREGKGLIYPLLALVWVVMYLRLAAGDAQWGWPGFSYTAAFEAMKNAPAIIGILVALLIVGKKKSVVGLLVVAMVGMAVITHCFSGRDIIVENSSRFIYHGILIGYVVCLEPIIRLGPWLKKELIHSNVGVLKKVVDGGALASLIVISLWPAGAAFLTTHDNLMRNDHHVVGGQEIEAMRWVRENSDVDDVFIASPESPWVIPLFTGRAVVRAEDYWLSKNDEVLDDIKLAFAGDRGAQARSLLLGDWLVLERGDPGWLTVDTSSAYENASIRVYKLR